MALATAVISVRMVAIVGRWRRKIGDQSSQER
jgi:hypothetical protein